MTDVTVTNRRADSSANEDLTQLARHGADAFGYKANLRIDRKLAQLLRLRVSQINNCTYCLNLHYEAARDAGIPRPVIDTLTGVVGDRLPRQCRPRRLRLYRGDHSRRRRDRRRSFRMIMAHPTENRMAEQATFHFHRVLVSIRSS
ncbi:MAG TPA: carboxymuconolactone decarboxylase family protein [Actinomycetes bacterium]|nr:carboxymuconolactone decarboxylase family protein [Actinomycetes bacterium]